MEKSYQKDQGEKKLNEIKTIPIPYSNDELKHNITITTDYFLKLSKKEIINKAIKLHSDGNLSGAERYYKYIIDNGTNDPIPYTNYGIILRIYGKLEEAKCALDKAIKLKPNFSDAYNVLGAILKDQGKLKEAELSHRKAIQLKPNFAEAYSNLGNILKDQGKLNEAELLHRKAIQIKPKFAEAYSNLGNILKDQGKLNEAELVHRKAIKIRPDFAEAYSNLGIILKEKGKLNEAASITLKAIEIKPRFSKAHTNLGGILLSSKRFNESSKYYQQAIKLNPKSSSAKLGLIECDTFLCDWRNNKLHMKWLEKLGIEGKSVPTMSLLYLEDNPLKQLIRAKNLYKQVYKRKPKILPFIKKDKINVGYFSADFRSHPTMYLISRVLELHDKSKFNIFLYRLGFSSIISISF